jgi:hypothetical protein
MKPATASTTPYFPNTLIDFFKEYKKLKKKIEETPSAFVENTDGSIDINLNILDLKIFDKQSQVILKLKQ